MSSSVGAVVDMAEDKVVDAEALRAEMRADVGRARRKFVRAQKNLDRFINDLDTLIDRIEAGEIPTKTEIEKIVKDFSVVLMHADKEAEKYERRVLENTGLIADAPLDLDTIRAEIGSKLDRLRDTKRAE